MVKYTLKEKILKLLIENNEKTYSIREISKQLNRDYKNTFDALKNLNSDLYLRKKQGNAYLIEFNPRIYPEVISIEDKRKEEFLDKNPKLRTIKKYIDELDYPFLIVLIFGSYVKNTKKQGSDIDICIISDNQDISGELIDRLQLLSLKIEIQKFTTKEFISMIKTKEDNLGKEIVKNNIILYGIENYYNLISKWMKKE